MLPRIGTIQLGPVWYEWREVDEKWTWKHPDSYFLFVSYERFDGLTFEQPTGNLVWMALRRGAEERRIGSAQVDMPRASAAPYHGRCR